ncbi:hypothetical protein EDB19DRAFT_1893797 [Suillus lakei]|nr:hypothetical protein EDB19DRAFT_1893797 [Suillus lakei]
MYSGEGADEVPLDPYRNLTTRVALYLLRSKSFPSNLLSIHYDQIPFGRGLDSSSAAGNCLGKLKPSDESESFHPLDAGEDWGLSPSVLPLGIGHYVIKALTIIPRFEADYSRKDPVSVFTALGQTTPDPDFVLEAMKDDMQQPYRMACVHGLRAVTSLITTASHPGLLGPTILALATHNFESIAKILGVAEGSTVAC